MHPAPSLIVFTVVSGLGLGLLAWIGLGFGAATPVFAWVGPGAGLALAALGGAASALHLARPDRAWRAFSQWRTSWLSREACLMVATLALFGLYAALWALFGLRLWGLGWLVAALALGTIYCTAMIYASLRTVPRWSVAPTPALFLTLALGGGFLAVEMLAALTGGEAHNGRVLLALALSGGVAIWWQTQAAGANRRSLGSDIGSATGLGGRGRVRAFEAPHTSSNYLLDEMAYQVGRKRAFALRRLGAILGFALPFALTLLALLLGDWLLGPALLAHLAGMLALRWLFFAEAEHVQALYYGIR